MVRQGIAGKAIVLQNLNSACVFGPMVIKAKWPTGPQQSICSHYLTDFGINHHWTKVHLLVRKGIPAIGRMAYILKRQGSHWLLASGDCNPPLFRSQWRPLRFCYWQHPLSKPWHSVSSHRRQLIPIPGVIRTLEAAPHGPGPVHSLRSQTNRTAPIFPVDVVHRIHQPAGLVAIG